MGLGGLSKMTSDKYEISLLFETSIITDSEPKIGKLFGGQKVANPAKTEFVMMGAKEKDTEWKVKAGEKEITQTKSAKLWGRNMNEDQK